MKAVVALVTAALTVAVVGGSVGAMYPADRTDGSFYAAANGRGAGDCTGPIGGQGKNPAPGKRSAQDDAFTPAGNGRGAGDCTGPIGGQGKNPAPGKRSAQDDAFTPAGNGRGPGDGTGPIGGGICPNPNPGPRGPGGGKR
jgi:hypothetical protein